MAGNSLATYWKFDKLKYLWWLYNSGESCKRSSSMYSCDIICWITQLHISKGLSLCVNGQLSKTGHIYMWMHVLIYDNIGGLYIGTYVRKYQI